MLITPINGKGFVAEQFFKWVGPYQRGFFCDDDSIRLPYKSSTVPDWLLLVYALGVPPFVVSAIQMGVGGNCWEGAGRMVIP